MGTLFDVHMVVFKFLFKTFSVWATIVAHLIERAPMY